MVYFARAPKSIEVYRAYSNVKECLRTHTGPLPPVPLHLRNAPTRLMKNLGYGKGYKYNPAYKEPVEQDYLPEELKGTDFFKERKTWPRCSEWGLILWFTQLYWDGNSSYGFSHLLLWSKVFSHWAFWVLSYPSGFTVVILTVFCKELLLGSIERKKKKPYSAVTLWLTWSGEKMRDLYCKRNIIVLLFKSSIYFRFWKCLFSRKTVNHIPHYNMVNKI